MSKRARHLPAMLEPLEPRLLLSGSAFTVTSAADVVADDGVVSLREAILAANTNAAVNEAPAGSGEDVDVIRFSPGVSGGSIELTGGALTITEALSIEGDVTVDGGEAVHVFCVDAPGGVVTLEGLTITGGRAEGTSGPETYGGGIYGSAGDVVLSGVEVSGNAASGRGGGVYLYPYGNGTLTVRGSIISGNTGGGIVAGRIALTDSTVATNGGTGIRGRAVTLLRTNVTGNAGTGVYGGGVTARDSTISGNERGISGDSVSLVGCSVTANSAGGIQSFGTVSAVRSSISGNSGAAYSEHAAVYTVGALTLDRCTISGNTDGYDAQRAVVQGASANVRDCRFIANVGGAIEVGDLEVENSIFQSNTADGVRCGSIRAVGVSVSGNGGLGISVAYGEAGTVEIAASDVSDNVDGAIGGAGISVAVRGSTLCGNGGDAIRARSASVADSRIEGNEGNAVNAESFVSVRGSEILANAGVGISATSVQVTDSVIQANGGSGISAFGSYTSARVRDSSILDNGGTGIGAYTLDLAGATVSGNAVGVSGAEGTLAGCVISRNAGVGVHGVLPSGAFDVPVLTVEACQVLDNGQGGIDAYGQLVLIDSTVSGNRGVNGGGVAGTSLELVGSSITSNYAGESGGGVWFRHSLTPVEEGGPSPHLSVLACTISSNVAGGDGGGIGTDEYTLSGEIVSSTLSNNRAAGDGGGVYAGANADILVANSLVRGNRAFRGAGLSFGERGTVRGGRVSDNVAEDRGGGILGGMVQLEGALVSGNHAGFFGGGVYGALYLADGVVSGNTTDYEWGHAVWDYENNGYLWQYNEETQQWEQVYMTVSSANCDVSEFHISGGQVDEDGVFIGPMGPLTPPEPGAPDWYAPYSQPTIDRVAGIIDVSGPLRMAEGESVTLDASRSIGGDVYEWDLDGDGEYDDGSGSAVELTWEQASLLGLGPGGQQVGLRVTGEYALDEAAAHLTVSADRPGHPELLAREAAYEDWQAGQYVGYGGYRADAVFRGGDGFYGIGLVSNAASESPVLLLRGTETSSPADVLADLDPEGVGYGQYQSNRAAVEAWLLGLEGRGLTADFVGHSLGGALAQWFAADWTAQGHAIGDVTTYNSPGIGEAHAAAFDPALAAGVTHYVVNGDVASLAGDEFIAGSYVLASYNTWSPLDKHLCPLTVAEAAGRQRPDDLQLSAPQPTEHLSDDWFHYNDVNYWGYLLAARTALPRVGVGRLFFRHSTEALRREVGAPLSRFVNIDAQGVDLQGELTIKSVSLPAVGWGLRDIHLQWDQESQAFSASGDLKFPQNLSVGISLELTGGSLNGVGARAEGLNVPLGGTGLVLQSIEADLHNFGEQAANPLSFEGQLGLTYGPQVSVNLPDWLGGPTEGALAGLDVSLIASGDVFSLQGEVELVEGAVGTGSASLTLDLSGRTLNGDGQVDLLAGLVQASTGWTIGLAGDAPYFSTYGTAALGIPETVPILGGAELADGRYRLEFSDDGDVSNDRLELAGQINLPIWGEHDVAVEICMDGTVSVRGLRGAPAPAGLSPQPMAVADSSGGPSIADETVGDAPSAMLVASWQNEQPGSELILMLDGGETVWESDIPERSDIYAAADLATPTRRVFIVDRPAADCAGWTAQLAGTTETVQLKAYERTLSPSLSIDAVAAQPNGPVDVDFSVDGEAAAGSLYLDEDADGYDGVRIAGGLDGATGTFVWSPTDMPSGTYHLYASADDGVSPVVSAYYAEPIVIETAGVLSVTDDSDLDGDRSVSFDPYAVGREAEEMYELTLTNAGLATVTVSAISLSGVEQGEFSVRVAGGGDSAGPWELRPDAVLTLDVGFLPGRAGSRAAEATIVTDIVGQEEITVRLWGVGKDGSVGQHLFYNNSSLDGYTPGSSSQDDNAVDRDRRAMTVPDDVSDLSISAYAAGLNGLMMDIVPAAGGELTAGDVLLEVANCRDADWWRAAPDPAEIVVRPGAGDYGSDRLTMIWPDAAIEGQWLRVTVAASEATGLDEPVSFYYAALPGDIDADARVTARDMLAVRRTFGRAVDEVEYDASADLNRDGVIDALDLAVVRENLRTALDEPAPPELAMQYTSGDPVVEPVPFIQSQDVSERWRHVEFRNDGDLPLTIGGLAVTGPDAEAFSFQVGTDDWIRTTAFVLQSGQSETVHVEFSPTEPGNYQAQLQWIQNDPSRPTAAQLVLYGDYHDARLLSSEEAMSDDDTFRLVLRFSHEMDSSDIAASVSAELEYADGGDVGQVATPLLSVTEQDGAYVLDFDYRAALIAAQDQAVAPRPTSMTVRFARPLYSVGGEYVSGLDDIVYDGPFPAETPAMRVLGVSLDGATYLSESLAIVPSTGTLYVHFSHDITDWVEDAVRWTTNILIPQASPIGFDSVTGSIGMVEYAVAPGGMARLEIGPGVFSVFGQMDQDSDGVLGEELDDVYDLVLFSGMLPV